MMKRSIELANRLIALMMICVIIASCSLNISGPEAISESMLVSRSSRLLELYLDEVSGLMTDDELPGFSEALARGFSAEDVASRTLGEENGRSYLEFTLYTNSYESVDEVLAFASTLAPEEDIEGIRETISEMEEMLYEDAEVISRAMTAAERKTFYSELRKLVVKASVLFTAAVVYAYVPSTVFWGKVTAASAVAIAAGILAASFMSLIEYWQTGSSSVTFSEWVSEISSEPTASWAIASGVIATNSAIAKSAVTASIILIVFAIYGIADDLKPLLKAYS